MLESIYNFDLSVFNAVFSIHNEVLNTVMTAITHLGEAGVLWIVIAILMLLFKKTRKYGLMLAGALLVMEVVNNEVLKELIARPRPFYAFNPDAIPADHKYYEELLPKCLEKVREFPELASKWVAEYQYPDIVSAPSSWSFPSGHTSSAFASATAIFAANKKWGAGAYVFAALMGFTRIYLGVHYFSDVLAGAVVGVIYGIIGILVVKGIIKILEKKCPKAAKWL